MPKISFDEFVEKYEPEVNKFNEGHTDEAPFGGFMFETYGDELLYVSNHQKEFKDVWTLVEEEGKSFIVYGMRKVNRLGYFITHKLPLDPDIIVDLEDEPKREIIEERYMEAKKELEIALKAYKELKRKEFLKEVLSRIEDKELLDAIEAFGPIEAYPQNDVFIYDGYRVWADSIIFRNWYGEEKAVVIDTDGDFDIERISVYHKSDISIFFENEDGDELTDFHSELANIPHVPELLEEVEVVK